MKLHSFLAIKDKNIPNTPNKKIYIEKNLFPNLSQKTKNLSLLPILN